MEPWLWGADILPWGQENHLVQGSLQHQEIPAEREGGMSISRGKGGAGQGQSGLAEGTATGPAMAHLASRLARGSSQSRGAHGTRGATLTTGSRRTLFARFTLGEKTESAQRRGVEAGPSASKAAAPGMVLLGVPRGEGGTHRGAGETGEASLSSLTGQADHTTLSSDALRSGSAGSTLGAGRRR